MAKKVHYHYKPTTRNRMRITEIILVLVIALLISATLEIRHIYESNLQPVSGSNQTIVVTIPTGSNLATISTLLKKDSVIKSNWAFVWYVRNDNNAINSIEAGTYDLHPDLSVAQIVTDLTDGKVSSHFVVILPGQRLDQVESALISDGFNRNDVISALSPNQYVSQFAMFKSKPTTASLEGFLYPDSFARNSSTKAQDIIEDSLTEMQSKLTPDIVSGMAAQGLNVFQGVTLASIVEQEVNNSKDKPMVAQVFLSRMKGGMNLGSDVTAYYGDIIAGVSPSLTYNSPYNTLLNSGLPPGPISNVSESSLEAVAHPSSTDYLYFVTGDNGITYYSTTLDQHNQQVQQYCQKLCSSP